MTKIITTAVFALVSFLCQAQVSEARKTGKFSKIEVQSGIELIYSESEEVSIKTEAENTNELKNIVTEMKGKTLKIYYLTDKNTAILSPLKVYVNANNVTSFKATSKSKLVFNNAVKSEEITIDVSSGASFSGTLAKNTKTTVRARSGAIVCSLIDTDFLDGNFKSGASVSFSGKAQKANLSASSGAFCTAKNLASEKATISAIEISSVLIQANGSIKAEAENGSSITYFGNPNVVKLTKNSFAIVSKKNTKQVQIAMD